MKTFKFNGSAYFYMVESKFDIKEEYEKLLEKYKNLPSFAELNNEFELNSIEKPNFLMRNIRRKINEKVMFFCKILESVLYPSLQTTISGYEANFFNDQEKNSLMLLHKKLMIFEKESLFLDIECNSEEKDAEYIKKVYNQWKEFKFEMNNAVKKMMNSWNEELKDDGETYFG